MLEPDDPEEPPEEPVPEEPVLDELVLVFEDVVDVLDELSLPELVLDDELSAWVDLMLLAVSAALLFPDDA